MARTQPKEKLPKPVMAWAGLSDGKLHCWETGERYYEIYPTKALAEAHYESFVRVRIVPVRRKKTG